eukprot:TRINITY_DN10727_c0_g1_i1.p1 TRINITY_DN10727_c0_g1~~TRINITY_DN10727_c0_g1_i1.p1  ORF type:complete len:260 (+),score=74.38 TRINITY_DN10727_c0_g1_i1:78-782(+)
MASSSYINDIRQQMQALKQQLNVAKKQFESYTEMSTKSLLDMEQQSHISIQQDRETVATLQQREKDAIALKEKIDREQENEAQLEESKRAEIKNLKQAESQLPAQVSRAQRDVEVLKQEIVKLRAVLAEKEQEKQLYEKELSKGIDYFKNRIGLEFHRLGASRLRFIFTMIDPERESFPYFFSILLNTGKYEVIECEPALSASRQEELLAELNTSNNLSKFVRCMRQISNAHGR